MLGRKRNNFYLQLLRKKKIYKYVYAVLLILICLEFLRSKYTLQTNYYEIKAAAGISGNRIRIVQLTDLHDAVFGINNQKLVDTVKSQHPDMIFITGDLVNSHYGKELSLAQTVISKMSAIAPVFVSLGNQELTIMNENNINVVSAYEEMGAIVIDYNYVDIEIKDNKLRIGGIYGYCEPEAYARESQRENESEFLCEFQDTDACKLLLCHMPVCWTNSYSLYDWEVDVVFSGHVHGGQVRIPFIGGLWAPDMGWFPGKLSGVYTTTEEGWKDSRKKLVDYANYMNYDTVYYEQHTEYYPSYLILSRGLGNTDWVPRFNNVPEIVVVDLVSIETSEKN